MGNADPDLLDAEQRLDRVTRVTLVVAVAGMVALIAYGAGATTLGRWQAALGAALIGLGAAAVGALLGFLFGVPVNAVAVAQASSASAQAAAAPGTAPKPSRGANQLVQISEWLTRIIIGATVTQLGTVRDQLQNLGANASSQLLGTDRGEIAFTAAVVFGAIVGFFAGHLSTRLILNVLFDKADATTLPTDAKAEVQARAADGRLDAISPAAAQRVVAVDERKLTDADDLQAWGLARVSLDRGLPGASKGVEALARAVAARPDDRATLRSLALGALYAPAPDGFTRARRELEAYFARHPSPTREDAQLLAYLACAHGQAYAHARDDAAAKASAAAGALAAVRQCLALDPSWRTFLEGLARGTTPGDDDLVAVTRDTPELRVLLFGETPAPSDKKGG